MAVTASGSVLVSHADHGRDELDLWGRPITLGRVRAVDPSGRLRTVGGGGTWPGDGVPPTAAQLLRPTAMASDQAGNVFLVEAGAARVRKLPNR